MEASQTAAPSFETVWAILQEVGEKQRETGQLIRELRESQKETDRQLEKTDRQLEKTAQQMEKYDKRFGDFSNRFGEVVEYMIAPSLQEKFWEYGLTFNETMHDRVFFGSDKNALFEVDVLLQNGDKAMLVEVKTKFTTEDVQDHIERLEQMREYADARGDRRTFLGAVAGVVMTPNVKKYALGQGFFVVEPSGETIAITPPHGTPKEW